MNEQKTPLARTLPLFVEKKIREWIDREGKAMPGHVISVNGAIVTVNLDVKGLVLPLVSMPLIGAEYVRLPIQQNDLGVCFPVDFGIGGVSGLGLPGATDTTRPGNLSALVWVPVGNKNWSSVDPNAVTIYGPKGVVIRDTSSASSITLTPTSITLVAGGKTVVLNSTGLTIDGIVFDTHKHTAGTYVAGSTPVRLESGGPTNT